MYRGCIKRLLDIVLSALGLIVAALPMLAVAILVRIKLGAPVLFSQERPGRGERIFTLYKFRTMTDARDENGDLMPDMQRLTAFGARLRALSIDELPQLINIIKGDMSFVGPRPLLVRYLPLYNERQRRRHEVRPGISGLAQVSGRNALSWEEKFELDVRYVETQSFALDVKLFCKTIGCVLAHEGINAGEDSTMEPFTGQR